MGSQNLHSLRQLVDFLFAQPQIALTMASPERLNPSMVDNSSSNNDEDSAGMLANVLRDNKVYLRGSAMGKGFRRAARYYLQEVLPQKLIEFEDKENTMASSTIDYDDNLAIPAFARCCSWVSA